MKKCIAKVLCFFQINHATGQKWNHKLKLVTWISMVVCVCAFIKFQFDEWFVRLYCKWMFSHFIALFTGRHKVSMCVWPRKATAKKTSAKSEWTEKKASKQLTRMYLSAAHYITANILAIMWPLYWRNISKSKSLKWFSFAKSSFDFQCNSQRIHCWVNRSHTQSCNLNCKQEIFCDFNFFYFCAGKYSIWFQMIRRINYSSSFLRPERKLHWTNWKLQRRKIRRKILWATCTRPPTQANKLLIHLNVCFYICIWITDNVNPHKEKKPKSRVRARIQIHTQTT